MVTVDKSSKRGSAGCVSLPFGDYVLLLNSVVNFIVRRNCASL
jgi:hypothetical protein